MLMRAHIGGATTASRLVVPSEAVITTGKRSIVIVKQADSRSQPVHRDGQVTTREAIRKC